MFEYIPAIRSKSHEAPIMQTNSKDEKKFLNLRQLSLMYPGKHFAVLTKEAYQRLFTNQ